MTELMATTHRFPRPQTDCPHPTSVWQPHRHYGDFDSEITCLGCGKVMVVPFTADFLSNLKLYFKELDLRRQLSQKAA